MPCKGGSAADDVDNLFIGGLCRNWELSSPVRILLGIFPAGAVGLEASGMAPPVMTVFRFSSWQTTRITSRGSIFNLDGSDSTHTM